MFRSSDPSTPADDAAEATHEISPPAAERRWGRGRRLRRDRSRRLAPHRPWNRHGLRRRWGAPLATAGEALDSILESLEGVRRTTQPGRAFARAQEHLTQAHASVDAALGRCEDIALAAQQLDDMLRALPKDRAADRGRLAARLDEAEERLRQHVAAMEAAAIAARELVLQSTLTSRDEDAVLDIGGRLRAVSEMLDDDPRT